MVPRTYPSSVDPVSGHTQMVAYMLPSVSGLTKWIDYIPVRKGNEQVVGGSYGSYIFVDAKMSQPSGQAWVDYIPVYEDGSATDAWMINAQGYIPYGSASIAAAIQAIRRNNGTALYVPDDYGLVLGPELVTNGGPFTTTDGWPAFNGATISTASGSLRITNGNYGGATFVTAATVGKQYRVRVVRSGGTATNYRGSLLGVVTTLNAGETSVAITATSNQTTAFVNSAIAGETLEISSYSVREIISATTYIDSTGTQPVTAINDLVGLLTDRSYGAGNLGGELSPGFSSATGWALGAGSAITDGKLVCTAMGTGVNAIYPIGSQQGKSYAVTYTIDTLTAGSIKLIASSGVSGQTRTTTGTFTELIVPTGTAGNIGFQPVATFTGSIASFSVREVLGNHASQPTTASKPLVTRVPRKLGPNIAIPTTATTGWGTTSASIASDGTALTVTNTSAAEGYANSSPPLLGGKTYLVTLVVNPSTGGGAITLAGTRIGLGGAGFKQYTVSPTSDFLSNGLRVSTNSATAGHTIAFQNISVQEVLEWTPALDFDGSNDLLTLSSGAILQQGSDHFVTAAFVLDAFGVAQTIYATSSSAAANPIVCQIWASVSGAISATWRDDAGATVTITGTTLTAGVSYVATAARVGGVGYLFLNGTQVGTSSVAALGTTTVNNASIGASVRNTTVNYLNGKLIDIALGQSTLTEADRKTIERNMAQRAGVTYVG